MNPPVVVGSASRDLTDGDSRGWRLGGAATYGALTLGRLGLKPRLLLGVDELASRAEELDWLRAAGVDLVLVRLPEGPVFTNVETPTGRIQRCETPGVRLAPDALPAGWSTSGTWMFVPVMDELDDSWAWVPPGRAFVALGWQGLLRRLGPDAIVQRRPPRASALTKRARLVALSRTDLDADQAEAGLLACLDAPVTLAITDGANGGRVVAVNDDARRTQRHYPAITADVVADPTGAGDAFLAGLVAGVLGHRLAGSGRRGSDLRLAAALGSLVVERPGLSGVPTIAAVTERLQGSLKTPSPSKVSAVADD
ncbi:MAG: PfkB family carbohydrate kinase [Chloroflexota bacterium]